jgi:phage gp36-like protein
MPYITQTDLLQRMSLSQLTQLTDDSNAGVPNAAVVAAALEEASGRVDGYCRGRYVTPLQQSDVVTTVARDVAVYLLFSRRPGLTPDNVRMRYEDAMSLLKDVSTGKAALDQPVSAAAPQSVAAEAVRPTRQILRFTDRNIDGFV